MSEESREEESYTVGNVRKAIEGLPDDARVDLQICLNCVDEMTDVHLDEVRRDGDRCIIAVEVYVMDPFGDDEDEDEDAT